MTLFTWTQTLLLLGYMYGPVMHEIPVPSLSFPSWLCFEVWTQTFVRV